MHSASNEHFSGMGGGLGLVAAVVLWRTLEIPEGVIVVAGTLMVLYHAWRVISAEGKDA